jgi:hypothetical protein
MTKIECDVKFCQFNEDNTCQKDEIEIKLFRGSCETYECIEIKLKRT